MLIEKKHGKQYNCGIVFFLKKKFFKKNKYLFLSFKKRKKISMDDEPLQVFLRNKG